MDKVDYKKKFPDLYSPKTTPEIINVPKMKFIMVEGRGNPNISQAYADALAILYGLSFTIKMSKMGSRKIDGYFDYVVPPLEGLWWMENATFDFCDKENFAWISMIRQPEFVDEEIFNWALNEFRAKRIAKKLPALNLENVIFRELTEGLCVQMMHKGSYDNEPKSFAATADFVAKNGYKKDKSEKWSHHEIYLTDPRRTKPEDNKTILRYKIAKS